MLGFVAFATANTLQAAQRLWQHYNAVRAGDVTTIRPWMTIHVISRIYHVPEVYLYHSLNIDNPGLFHHATLYRIANRQRKPVDQIIRTIQGAILAYRNKHPGVFLLMPQRSYFSPAGREKY
jgi:hypothetical protein